MNSINDMLTCERIARCRAHVRQGLGSGAGVRDARYYGSYWDLSFALAAELIEQESANHEAAKMRRFELREGELA